MTLPVYRRYWLVGLLLLLALAGCGERALEPPVSLDGEIFGTYYRVTLAEPMTPDEAERLEGDILGRLEDIDAAMSTYRDDSALSAFNRAPVGAWQPLSPELIEVLTVAQSVARASGGAFDVTIGGLVNLWSFGPEARPREVPGAAQLAERLAEVGPDTLEVDAEAQRARRLKDVYVDLSGVAKGYAVDRVAAYLADQGLEHYLVDIGGELVGRGYRDGEAQPWRIGVEVPDARQRVARYVLPLHEGSVATSGDYRNYFEEDGRRYSHTIDPRTGRPIRHGLASVTVFAPANAWADAWATAITVLGPEAGLALAERESLPVLLLIRDGEDWVSRASSALVARFGAERLAEAGIEPP